jgi:hypothetical protein
MENALEVQTRSPVILDPNLMNPTESLRVKGYHISWSDETMRALKFAQVDDAKGNRSLRWFSQYIILLISWAALLQLDSR